MIFVASMDIIWALGGSKHIQQKFLKNGLSGDTFLKVMREMLKSYGGVKFAGNPMKKVSSELSCIRGGVGFRVARLVAIGSAPAMASCTALLPSASISS